MSRESYSEFCDRIPYIILKAPDHFPRESGMDLEKAFADLTFNMERSCKELGEEYERISRLVSQSLASYRSGNIKSGIKLLQDVYHIVK